MSYQCELCGKCNRTWNIGLLTELFYEHDVHAIFKIDIPQKMKMTA
jgi:predicted nicotinamide N-methyase